MMFNRRVGGDIAAKELRDSVSVLAEEKSKTALPNPSEMTDEEWAENIKRMGKLKNGEQKL